jgi:CRISPR-associated RAMP protein (TIGR02581 family)
MLKRKLCQAKLVWPLHCPGPLLIADGRYRDWLEKRKPKKHEGQAKTDDKGSYYPNQVFISRDPIRQVTDKVSQHPNQPESYKFDYYIPGTSLRGPLRAQAERILRSIGIAGERGKTACDPFADKETAEFKACSHHLETNASAETAYARVCPACKLFGCAGAASRVRIAEAKIDGYTSSIRDMIGIDRFSGGVHQGANMHFHVLENARFTLEMEIDNFELWHLGLLAYVFRDVQDGLLPIGAGKTKGFGLISGKLDDIAVNLLYPCSKADGSLHDLGSLATDAERRAYAFHRTAPLAFEGLEPEDGTAMDLYRRYRVQPANIADFWRSVADEFNAYLAGGGQEAA